MKEVFAVFLGAGAGGLLRYWVGLSLARVSPLPLGTLSVNIFGSFLMGCLMGWLVARPNEFLRLLLTTGVMGGFTTFSAFSYEVLKLFQQGETGVALGYIAASLFLSLLACALGFYLTR